jgi:hypothetical protein
MNDTLIVPAAIQNLDLSAVRERLLRKKGWTAEYADRLIEEYREYLALFYFHPGEELVPPTQDLDDVWHEHILDTRRYGEDCRMVFGRFIHHIPGLEPGTDRHAEGLSRTRRHWWQLFGRRNRHALSFQQNVGGGFDTVTLGSSCTSYMPPAHEHASFFDGWFSGGHSGGAGGGADFGGPSSTDGGAGDSASGSDGSSAGCSSGSSSCSGGSGSSCSGGGGCGGGGGN